MTKIRFFISRIHSPFVNLAIEEYLFTKMTKFDSLLLYRNSPCVVLGRNQNPFKELNFERIRQDNIPVTRRQSGGGTVYHDLGNSNYFHIMPKDRFHRDGSVSLVAQALHELDIPARVNNRHDICIGNDKVSGSAFKLVRDRAYHHGTMLIDTNLDLLDQYLKPKPKILIGPGTESVPSSVTRLRDHSFTADHPSFWEAVFNVYSNEFEVDGAVSVFEQHGNYIYLDNNNISAQIDPIAHRLSQDTWKFGQTPNFSLLVQDVHEFNIEVQKGMIVGIEGVLGGKDLIGQYLHSLSSASPETNAIIEKINKVI